MVAKMVGQKAGTLAHWWVVSKAVQSVVKWVELRACWKVVQLVVAKVTLLVDLMAGVMVE